MRAAIKNCGLKTPDAIMQAARTGASYVGFISHEPSPRHLSLTDMASLATIAKEASLKTVAVLVNPSDALLSDIVAQVKPEFIQIHKVTSPTRILEITSKFHLPVITAIAIHSAEDLANAQTFDMQSAHLLFDAKDPGSGKAFDWSLLTAMPKLKPWFLAGGLNPGNVAEALVKTGAPMVDVSSGIESAPGVKSLEKIAAFNAAVLGSA